MTPLVEHFVLLTTAFAVMAFVGAVAVRMRAQRNPRWMHPASLVRLYTAAVVLPPIAAAWLVLAALLPTLSLPLSTFEALHQTPEHDAHLLSGLLTPFEPWLSHALLGLFLGSAVFALCRVGRHLWRSREVRRLFEAAERVPRETDVGRPDVNVIVLAHNTPFAFVWGFRRLQLVMSSAVLRVLDELELRTLVEHEVAHADRRDNAAKLALEAWACLSLLPLPWMLLRWRAQEIELLCDEVAAARTGAPLDVASALLKIGRGISSGSRALASSFASDSALLLERRVARLVELAEGTIAASPVNTLIARRTSPAAVTAAFTLSIAVLYLAAPLAVHHVVERAIQLLCGAL